MAKLSLVLGSVLRDLAQSRVISDAFSRDVSTDYEGDPILRLFPVPRIEIKEVNISLPISVKNVQSGEVQAEKIIKTMAKSQAAILAAEVLDDLITKRRNKDALTKAFETGQAQKKLSLAIEQKIAQTIPQITRTLEGEKTDLSGSLCDVVRQELIADKTIARELLVETNDAALKSVILRTVDAYVRNRLLRDAKVAVASAQDTATEVDVGITTAELTGIPESAITRINIVADVKNYQWTKVDEVDGKSVRQLVPE